MQELALHVDKNYAGNPIRAVVPRLGHDDPAKHACQLLIMSRGSATVDRIAHVTGRVMLPT
jgi:hypothetical protein